MLLVSEVMTMPIDKGLPVLIARARDVDAATRPVSIEELRGAWRALQAGAFRRHPGTPSRAGCRVPAPGLRWAPTEPVVPVLGCHGHAGASTISVAIATAAAPSRVLECGAGLSWGLAGAVTAELGENAAGWRSGRRESVWIDRAPRRALGAEMLPLPAAPPARVNLTVLDAGWALPHLAGAGGWVTEHVNTATVVVVVTTANLPGLRALEETIAAVGAPRVVAAVLGPPRRRWPRELATALGARTRAVEDAGRLVSVPHEKTLALRGVDETDLLAGLLKAGRALLELTGIPAHLEEGPLP